jgi:hypothetical protein
MNNHDRFDFCRGCLFGLALTVPLWAAIFYIAL